MLKGEISCPSAFVSFAGQVDLEELLNAVHHNTTVRGLRLKNTGIDDAYAERLCGALRDSGSAITTLELPDNNIGPGGAGALHGLLEACSDVVAVDLSGKAGPTRGTTSCCALRLPDV